MTEDVAATERVADALAAATGTDPTRLEPPLYDVVDPDALDALVEGATGVRVSFDYDGHHVVVHGDGAVTVDGNDVAGEQVVQTAQP